MYGFGGGSITGLWESGYFRRQCGRQPQVRITRGDPLDAYQKVIDANVRGNLWLCQQLLPQMRERKDGVIITSTGTLIGTPGTRVYSMSRAANMSFVRTLAVENGPNNIRANAIAPGLILTDMAHLFTENPELRQQVEARVPMRRLGKLQEIASIAFCLASDAGSYLTGQTIVVNRGVYSILII